MDSTLTFKDHINEVHKKVFGTLLYLNRVSDRFDPACMAMVVQSLVLTILNYCLSVWGSTNLTQMHRVKKLQNFAPKVAVGGVSKFDHVTPLFEKLNWLRMNDKYIFDVCVLVFKIRNKMFPEWLFSLPTVDEMRGGNITTRNQNHLFTQRFTTDTGARCLNVVGPTFWNRLPLDVRNCQTLPLFKGKLTSFLLDS